MGMSKQEHQFYRFLATSCGNIAADFICGYAVGSSPEVVTLEQGLSDSLTYATTFKDAAHSLNISTFSLGIFAAKSGKSLVEGLTEAYIIAENQGGTGVKEEEDFGVSAALQSDCVPGQDSSSSSAQSGIEGQPASQEPQPYDDEPVTEAVADECLDDQPEECQCHCHCSGHRPKTNSVSIDYIKIGANSKSIGINGMEISAPSGSDLSVTVKDDGSIWFGLTNIDPTTDGEPEDGDDVSAYE